MYRRLHKNKVEYQLTILILTLPSRDIKPIFKKLQSQIINRSVQILYVGDNKSTSVGVKRNKALSLANGRYVTFIDDDDMISYDYIDEIFKVIEQQPDVITFNYIKTINGNNDKLHKYYKNNGRAIYMSPDKSHYKMLPNHLCVWRKEKIVHDFPDRNLSEDHQWAELMDGHYNSVINIDKVLYYYNYSKEKSETH